MEVVGAMALAWSSSTAVFDTGRSHKLSACLHKADSRAFLPPLLWCKHSLMGIELPPPAAH